MAIFQLMGKHATPVIALEKLVWMTIVVKLEKVTWLSILQASYENFVPKGNTWTPPQECAEIEMLFEMAIALTKNLDFSEVTAWY
jgi:hypothetical protein